MLLSKYKYIYIIKIIFLILSGIIFLFLYGFSNKSNNIQGDIVFVLDVSHSMNVTDISNGLKSTSRLDMAKKIIQETMNKNPNNKFGLVLFSQKSNYFLPPTFDKKTFDTYVSKLNTNAIPAGGTNIYLGLKNFIENSQDGTIGIVISDLGESTDLEQQKDNIIKLKDKLITKKQKLIILGMGTKEGGVVKLPSGEILTSTKQGRNDEFGEFLKNEFNGTYQIFENSYLQNVNLDSNNTYNLNKKNQKIMEIIATLLGILSI